MLAGGIAAGIRAVEPGALDVDSELEPAAGTILMALEEAGDPVDDGRLVKETVPGREMVDALHPAARTPGWRA